MPYFYKLGDTPQRYQSFQKEFACMQKLLKLMQKQGDKNLYRSLFPVYHNVGWTKNKLPYICMEYIQGQTLEEILCHRPRQSNICQLFSNRQILHIYEQLHTALHWLVRAGMLQIDLSPQNLMILNEQCDLRLIDFTDCYYTDGNAPYQKLDYHINPMDPVSIQLRDAGAYLFTRLFFSGQTHYAEAFLTNKTFFITRYPTLFRHILHTSPMDLDLVPAAYDGEELLSAWDAWYAQLCRLLHTD